ncbi:hypothetical protein BCR42DRAFT_495524 [Absidia repens]|uniref:Integrase zinc-binding domain-containing protein n=1 Tax=Absidia repens TaxID=90262 RepID=A0A1X2I3C6_9FUNG|nr:hypothetical protein BCR42DRAFT_495524 [Absidia repens]
MAATFNSQLLNSEHCRVSDRGDSSYHVVDEDSDNTLLTINTSVSTLSILSPSTSRSSSLTSSSTSSAKSPTSSIFSLMEPNCLCDHDQYPVSHMFDSIVQDYLRKLSIKKRDKALINRKRYGVILQVLKDPRNTSVGSAQFRFWVKKMFKLSAKTSVDTGQQNQPSSTWVVCHNGKPVAIQEQIYGILIQAHKEAHHGGRDKTSALVRKRYSWIPKELTARFVQICPFCIARRNGHPNRPSCNQLTLAPPISVTATKNGSLCFIKQETQPDSTTSNVLDTSDNLNCSNLHHPSRLEYYDTLMTAPSTTSNREKTLCHQYQHDKRIIEPPTPTDAIGIDTTTTANATPTKWMESGVSLYHYAKPPSHDDFSYAAMDLHTHDGLASGLSSTGSCDYSSIFVDHQFSSSDNNINNNNNTILPPASTVDSIISQCNGKVLLPPSLSRSFTSWPIVTSPTTAID